MNEFLFHSSKIQICANNEWVLNSNDAIKCVLNGCWCHSNVYDSFSKLKPNEKVYLLVHNDGEMNYCCTTNQWCFYNKIANFKIVNEIFDLIIYPLHHVKYKAIIMKGKMDDDQIEEDFFDKFDLRMLKNKF